ncbi:hypothetical protein V8G54_003963 [Vigna mungo]|uniref:Uncharacterized protein n=1 Tax=Vigna mungo TaxID=3915 RepID=A0AAQ3SAL5_VIGMU
MVEKQLIIISSHCEADYFIFLIHYSFTCCVFDEAGQKLADVLDNDDRDRDASGSEGSSHNIVEENSKKSNEEPIVKSEVNDKAGNEESSGENVNKDDFDKGGQQQTPGTGLPLMAKSDKTTGTAITD